MKCSFLLLLSPLCLFSQGVEIENPLSLSNIQTYTPSKLLSNDQWDIKWFNNLYTETKEINHTKEVSPVARRNFFTSTLDIFCGISPSKRLNVGFIITYRSATINGENLLAPFSFQSSMNRRLGISRLAPAIKFTPFKKWPKFAIQSSLSIPLFENETEKKIFLDQKGYIFQNRFFYDYLAPNNKIQIYTELNTELNFGPEEDSFANDSFRVTPGVFFSYFPFTKSTLLVSVQHSNLIALSNAFSQNFTSLGGGVKYQLTKVFNLEVLYTNFIRGERTGLGETFNLGLRALIN